MSEALRMTVIGTGYLGATHAAAMAESGYDVLGVDVDAEKVAALARGEVPFFEPGLPSLLEANVAAGRLRFTTDFAEAADFGDLHFIGVGTPQHPRTNAADLSQLDAAIGSLAPLLRRPCTVVGKSTVPVGTATNAPGAPAGPGAGRGRRRPRLEPGVPARGVRRRRHPDPRPDRRRPGRPVRPRRAPGRDEQVMRRVYAPMIELGAPFLVMDFATAELVKVAANSFLATKISFINAMAEVCEATGADVTRLAEAIGYDERIGAKFLRAGIGFGGGCLPKDIRAFMARAGELGVSDALSFLRDVDGINTRRRASTVALARELVGGRFVGRRIAVLGAAFKPDSDDVRDSPALDIAAAIYTAGGDVVVHDPQAMANARAAYPTMSYANDVRQALQRRRPRAAAHRVARLHRARPPGRGPPSHHAQDPRRAQRAGPRPLARCRLELPGPGPPQRLTRRRRRDSPRLLRISANSGSIRAIAETLRRSGGGGQVPSSSRRRSPFAWEEARRPAR